MRLCARLLGIALGFTVASSVAFGQGSTLVLVQASVARHLNSAVQSGVATGMPAAQIFASPLRYDGDDDWTAKPYLAESWALQDDGRSLLLRLVKNATFHDGKPITSADVAFSIMAIKANHPFQSMFAQVERVDTPSPHIAIIRHIFQQYRVLSGGESRALYGSTSRVIRPAQSIRQPVAASPAAALIRSRVVARKCRRCVL